jgi:hypothetical protein
MSESHPTLGLIFYELVVINLWTLSYLFIGSLVVMTRVIHSNKCWNFVVMYIWEGYRICIH